MKNYFILTFFLFFLLIIGCAVSDTRTEQLETIKDNEKYSDKRSILAPTARKNKGKKEAERLNTRKKGHFIGKDRKRIKRGNISLIVENFEDAEKIVEDKAIQCGGFIAGSNYNGSNLSIVVKIPATKFDAFLNASEALGKLQSKSVNVEDVTRQFYDLESRIKNKRILLERYQSYLRKAAVIEELLKIERKINDVTTEIENLEGSYKNLRNLIKFSTLNIQLRLPIAERVIARSRPSLKKGFQNIAYALVVFFYGFLFTVIYLLAFGIPILLIIAFFYLLTFGRIGLIIKLFRMLSKKT